MLRHKLKEDLDYDYFFASYNEYLTENQEAITKLFEYIEEGTNCLMCFEKSANQCHRSIVVNKIREYDSEKFEVCHI